MKTVDASTFINMYVFPEYFERHKSILDDDLIAPAIVIPEFLNGVKKMVLRKVISKKIADLAVGRFSDLNIELAMLSTHHSALWKMIHNFSSYDATYVLLANNSRTPLITSDARLARAAQRNTEVILLE